MDRDQNKHDYTAPNVPPATPPTVDGRASAQDAARNAQNSGDSDKEGANTSGLDRSAEDERIHGGDTDKPGEHPDEVAPGRGDKIEPGGPSEIEIEREDTDEPGSTPDESPPDAAPFETPPPPD